MYVVHTQMFGNIFYTSYAKKVQPLYMNNERFLSSIVGIK